MKVINAAVSRVKASDRQKRDLGDIDSLIDSIETVGLLHPIVIGPDYKLKAGYRRLHAFKIMGREVIPAHVAKDLDDVLSALTAERDENVQRKDLTPTEIVARAQELEAAERERAKARQEATQAKPGQQVGSGNLPEPIEDTGQTRDKVASAFGISGKTYEKAKKIVAAAEENPDLFGDLPDLMDESSPSRAHRELVKRQRREAPPLPTGKYRVLYADPPWKYNDSGIIGESDNYGHAERHYPPMALDEICAMGPKIKEMTEDNAVLFVWVPSPILEDCFKVINAWGFTYKASFVWDKVKHNYGHYNSVRHEFLLICTRGSCTPDVPDLIDSVQVIERSDVHSEKPEEFRVIIDTLYPNGSRVELFGRKDVEGWEVWGNEPR